MWVKAVQKPWPSRAYVPQHVSSIMVKEVSALLGQKEIELSDAEVPKANDKIWEQPHSDWSVFCQCRWWKVYIVRQRRGEHFVWERRVSLSSEKVRPPALLLLRNGLFTHITLQHRNPEVRDTACTCWPIWRGWESHDTEISVWNGTIRMEDSNKLDSDFGAKESTLHLRHNWTEEDHRRHLQGQETWRWVDRDGSTQEVVWNLLPISRQINVRSPILTKLNRFKTADPHRLWDQLHECCI